MSWEPSVDATARRGILRATGRIDLAGSVTAILALADDPALGGDWPIEVHLEEASYTPSLADAAKLGALTAHAAVLASHRVAFLTGDTPLHGVAGLLAGIASARNVSARAFKTRAEMQAWLASAG